MNWTDVNQIWIGPFCLREGVSFEYLPFTTNCQKEPDLLKETEAQRSQISFKSRLTYTATKGNIDSWFYYNCVWNVHNTSLLVTISVKDSSRQMLSEWKKKTTESTCQSTDQLFQWTILFALQFNRALTAQTGRSPGRLPPHTPISHSLSRLNTSHMTHLSLYLSTARISLWDMWQDRKDSIVSRSQNTLSPVPCSAFL